MATAVHNTVSSLPINLQTDWGKYAYELRRVPSLKDFVSWIDAIVGAEELRGAKLSSTVSANAAKPPAPGSTNRNNSNQNQSGSINYNNHNPTVLAQSLLDVAVFPECPACKENPGHRLEICNVFKRMIVNARAALCASYNHCFKCLIRDHYTRKCRRQNAGAKNVAGPTIRYYMELIGSFQNHQPIKLTGWETNHGGVQRLSRPKITLSRRKIDWPSMKTNREHLSGLELPSIDSSKVEVLIGMDFPSADHTLQVALPIEGEDGPTAHQTCFSWAVVGKIPRCLVTGPTQPCKNSPEPLAAYSISDEDDQMVAIINRSMTRLKCDYQIELPVKPNHPLIPNNRSQALSRFYGLEPRLLDPNMRGLAKHYEQKIDNLIASDTAVLVDRSEIDKPSGFIWHLPHFFVVNNNKPDKGIRVVFDCAARYKGVSLNCFLLRGPPSISYLVGILLRARQHSVAFSADITSFYHRIGVDEKHQSLQRFVFRKFGSNSPILTFTTLVFGEICASSAAVQTLQRAANDNVRFPHVATRLKDNFYSDNFCDSFETEEGTLNFAKDVTKSLASGGFALTGFASSSL
ncbi:uncharacterized protein LOC116923389 [Daphnia magna]|uniref:uncharacterized protein LOC116923389 n=1 Tax=Daphnia magna TaxID=35525 RepID=UPI0014024605|nr:uncharacterized protein LOC116923389 [Daphnia magna]